MAGQTIGELGPAENASATIRWYPIYNYPALSLWVLFILALIVSPAQREPAAWLILIPAVLIHLTWLLIKTICYFSPSEGQMISQIFIPLCIAIALIFVLARHIRGKNRFVSFLSALCVIGLVNLASFFAYNFGGTDISHSNKLALVFNLIMGTAFLLGFMIAAPLSRGRFARLKFVAGSLIVAFLFTAVLIFLFGLYDFRPSDLRDFTEILAVGLVFGLLLCGVVLPFAILVFTSSFYRRILCGYLRLPSIPEAPTEGRSERESAPEI